MSEPNSLPVVAIVLASLGIIFLVLRAVTVWAAPPSTGPRRPLPLFTSPTDPRPSWPMFTSSEAAADVEAGDDGSHAHGGSADHAGGGGHDGDAGGDGGH